MKIKIIGSGSMWTEYNSASYIIDDKIAIDFPNGMCKYLYKEKINPTSIDNVLITHFHGDHYFDIPFYYLLKSHAYNNKINIYCGKEGIKKIKQITDLAFPNSEENIFKKIKLNYITEDTFKINKYNIRRILVEHGNMKPAYGYIINTDSITVGFSGDTTICENIKYMAKTCNYLIIDCMLKKTTENHLGIDMLKKLCKENKNCIFITTHMDNDTREELKKQNINNIHVPNDGEIIEIN